MSRGFFSVVSSTPTLSLDSEPKIHIQYETSSDIEILFDKGIQDNYTFIWKINNKILSDLVKINNNNNTSPIVNFTNNGFIGKTTVHCSVLGNNTNIIIDTNAVDIYWNSLNATLFDVSWNIINNTFMEYDGTAKDVYVISTRPNNVEYIIKKKYAINAGEIASSIITGVIYHTGKITSPTITIIPRPISLLPNGTVSLLWNNTLQTISYIVSGAVPQDTNYSVSGIIGSDCNIYTAILSTSSPNYILETYLFNWKITPSIPENFNATVSYDFTSISLNWNVVGGCIYNIYNNDVLVGSSNTPGWTLSSLPDISYNLYVTAISPSGTSDKTPIAQIRTGRNSYSITTEYDSGYTTLSPCCVTGSKNGDVGLINWVQGTNGIVIDTIFIKNCVCNFSTTLLSGTATRTVRFNNNNVLSKFPLSTSTTVPNPFPGPVSFSIDTSRQQIGRTITYTLRATGTGWSINNIVCPSGIFWFSADWRNVGKITTTYPRVESIVSYV